MCRLAAEERERKLEEKFEMLKRNKEQEIDRLNK
jgi:hypothetical protein